MDSNAKEKRKVIDFSSVVDTDNKNNPERKKDIYEDVIGQHPKFVKAVKDAVFAARNKLNVLLSGETGTGKEVIARLIKDLRGPNVHMEIFNSPAISESLFESELFGHTKGSFTGAINDREGSLALAHKGILFMDEISELSLSMQVKLLRVLQDGSYRKVGGDKQEYSDFQLICATNKDLFFLAREGKFRDDLYYRIRNLEIYLPPLRERGDDIERLFCYFLKKYRKNKSLPVPGISPAVLDFLYSYDWPGNVRELSGLARIAIMKFENRRGEEIKMPDLPLLGLRRSNEIEIKNDREVEPATRRTDRNRPLTLRETEKRRIIKALENNYWIQKFAAKELGISSRALVYKIKKFGISHVNWRINRPATEKRK